MYILILFLLAGGSSAVVVPNTYPTEESCRAAGGKAVDDYDRDRGWAAGVVRFVCTEKTDAE